MIADIVQVAVRVRVLDPGHNGAVETIGFAPDRHIVEDVVQVTEQFLRHESEILVAAQRIDRVQVTVVGRDVRDQVRVTVGELAVLYQRRLRVQRVAHDAPGLH